MCLRIDSKLRIESKFCFEKQLSIYNTYYAKEVLSASNLRYSSCWFAQCLPVKSRKRLARDVLTLKGKSLLLLHIASGRAWQHSLFIFAIFKRRFLSQDGKLSDQLLCVFILKKKCFILLNSTCYSIPIEFLHFCSLLAISQLCQVIVVDRFYTALFSALEQTHCPLVACSSE